MVAQVSIVVPLVLAFVQPVEELLYKNSHSLGKSGFFYGNSDEYKGTNSLL